MFVYMFVCLFVCLSKVALTTLWGIRLVIFAKVEHKNKISHVQQSTVKTGLGNALGDVFISDVFIVLIVLMAETGFVTYFSFSKMNLLYLLCQ